MTRGRALTMDGDFWELVKSGGIAGGSLAVFYAITLKFVAWFFPFKVSRDDAKQARLDKGFASYTAKIEARCAQLETRCDAQEKEIEACHADKRELSMRVAKLEAMDVGIGALRANEQLIRALMTRIDKLEGRER